MRSFRCSPRLAAIAIAVASPIIYVDASASASTAYIYDPVGRLAVVVYDDGVCVTYSYDANGDRTSSNTTLGATGSLTWGSGLWGCTTWVP